VVLDQAVRLSQYPVLAPEGFLSQLKAAHEIQDDTFVNVGYGLLDGWPPPNLQDNEDRWQSTSPYQGLTQNNLHLLGNPVPLASPFAPLCLAGLEPAPYGLEVGHDRLSLAMS